ncbi:peptidase S24/S26A/S26B/S26C [Cristinia sonorae]|uniref:Peptidase S24/S26A/S26B/S26C n=1 Tax=Cristinia sonorae TaxID=1940300 RepID=A0A8K0UTW1_9AGAR|nr:peptidase S24/S26A/S26B/S26C [Cristinia sonorae]
MLNIWRTAYGKLSSKLTRPVLKKFALRSLGTFNFVCATHLFVQHVGWIHLTDGPSMMPTLAHAGEWVLESRLIDPQNLRRGDLAIYISPLDPHRLVCKRVLGLPGDIICVDPTGDTAPSAEHVVVPKGHLWFIGDNAEFSRDSRTYGPVSMGLVRGKLVAKVWPPSAFTVFQNNFNYID